MSWKSCGQHDPFTQCLVCGESSEDLEIYEQKSAHNFGKQYYQECAACGCLCKFYYDTQFQEYYCQTFKPIPIEEAQELTVRGKRYRKSP